MPTSPRSLPSEAKGLRGNRAVLTIEQVEQIRSRYAAGGVSQEALGKEYGVSQVHIGRLIKV